MTKVNFSIKSKKYQMAFDSKDNKVEIMQWDSKDKFIISPYKGIKTKDFINYILSLELK